MTTSSTQQIPSGDRPSGNIRGTRSPAVGRHGMIATSQSLASAAGLKVLQDGGNAIDAAVTAAAVLAVIEPRMNGIGGDLLAHRLRRARRRRSTASTRADAPPTRPRPKSSPGAASARCRATARSPSTCPASSKAGPAADALRHDLARPGARAGHRLRARRLSRGRADGRRVERQRGALAARSGDRGDVPARRHAAGAGRDLREPAAGAQPRADRQGRPRRVLQGRDRARDRRRHARRATACSTCATSPITRPTGSSRFGTNYRGYDVLEMPPSTQGFVALEMLNIMEGFDIEAHGPQLGRLPARGHRGQADRVRRSRRLPRRSRSHADGRAADAALEGLRRGAAQGDRHAEGRGYAPDAADGRPRTSPAATSATRST